MTTGACSIGCKAPTARACRRSACPRPRRRGTAKQSAAYNLYAIDGVPGAWIVRGDLARHRPRPATVMQQTQLIKLFG